MSRVSLPVPFGRVVTAMVTPFAADGSVELDLAARLAEHLVGRAQNKYRWWQNMVRSSKAAERHLRPNQE